MNFKLVSPLLFSFGAKLRTAVCLLQELRCNSVMFLLECVMQIVMFALLSLSVECCGSGVLLVRCSGVWSYLDACHYLDDHWRCRSCLCLVSEWGLESGFVTG